MSEKYRRERTVDRVGLCQLSAVFEQWFRNVVPCLALAEAQIHVCTRQVIDVELNRRLSATCEVLRRGRRMKTDPVQKHC